MKKRKSSKPKYYIISPRVIIKAIIIILYSAWYFLLPNYWVVQRSLWYGVPVPSSSPRPDQQYSCFSFQVAFGYLHSCSILSNRLSSPCAHAAISTHEDSFFCFHLQLVVVHPNPLGSSAPLSLIPQFFSVQFWNIFVYITVSYRSSILQRELVYGVCIGTAQVGTSLATLLASDSLLKRSSLRPLRDPLPVNWYICASLPGHCVSFGLEMYVWSDICARPFSLTKAFLPPLSTRLECLVVAIPLVC